MRCPGPRKWAGCVAINLYEGHHNGKSVEENPRHNIYFAISALMIAREISHFKGACNQKILARRKRSKVTRCGPLT